MVLKLHLDPGIGRACGIRDGKVGITRPEGGGLACGGAGEPLLATSLAVLELDAGAPNHGLGMPAMIVAEGCVL